MSAAQQEDGNLPQARRQLDDAISALADPQPQTLHDGTLTWLDSAYVQLRDAIPGSKRDRTGVAGSQPPLWIDACQLLHEIDTAVAAWERPFPALCGDLSDEPPPITILRLRAISDRSWRPQDVHSIQQIVAALESWCENITALLSDIPRWHLPAPCPACGRKTIYRHDNTGELVRQPALQITPQGCVCAGCHTTWAPQYFTHLARVLGYALPEGVLE